MKKKFNWGVAVTVAFVLFAGAILTVLYIALNTKVDLVSDNYYEKELKYQDHIDVVRNSESLEKNIVCTFSPSAVHVGFPRLVNADEYSGSILFFRPSDKSVDFETPVKLDTSYVQSIPTDKMLKGLWRMQVSWKAGSKEYYFEQPVMIQ